MSINLKTPLVEALATTKKHLQKLRERGINTVEDFLHYFPRAYEDTSKITRIANLTAGEDIQTIQGKITRLELKKTHGRVKVIEGVLEDETGAIDLVWFNQIFILRILRAGDMIIASGKVKDGFRRLSFSVSSYEKMSEPLIHRSGQVNNDYIDYTEKENQELRIRNQEDENGNYESQIKNQEKENKDVMVSLSNHDAGNGTDKLAILRQAQDDNKQAQSENQKTSKLVLPKNQKTRLPDCQLLHVGRIVPVYPEFPPISSHWLREKIQPFLTLAKEVGEYLPESIRLAEKLIKRGEAIFEIHLPTSQKKLEQGRLRLAFDELFLLQLATLQRKKDYQSGHAPQVSFNIDLIKSFLEKLPFQLTDAQRIASFQILKNLDSSQPMLRLLVGDVGSGKTVVAAVAALATIKSGFQVAIMAPTEILAAQHLKTLSELLAKFDVNIRLLLGATKTKERQEILIGIEDGTIDLIIGTHALIQKDVNFKNLGLAVIDEQHRFGVLQREKLLKANSDQRAVSSLSAVADEQLTTSSEQLIVNSEKESDKIVNPPENQKTSRLENQHPHLLTMTATPIPRTLAQVLYGDQDLSVINEMPKGRKKISTHLVPPKKRLAAHEWIRKKIKEGRQAFVVCPLIEDSEKLEAASAKREYDYLKEEVFPDLNIGILHGRMKSLEKQEVMQNFKKGTIDILVSTAVIEVGIDVPNAAIMFIENSERFGLSQLHQFRGRVGRGEHQSYCLLFTSSNEPNTLQRLNALTQTNDGFKLAEIDLKLRGPGEIYGTRQSGIPDLQIADFTNVKLISQSRLVAEKVLAENLLEKHPELKKKFTEFLEKNLKNNPKMQEYENKYKNMKL